MRIILKVKHVIKFKQKITFICLYEDQKFCVQLNFVQLENYTLLILLDAYTVFLKKNKCIIEWTRKSLYLSCLLPSPQIIF